MRTSLSILGLTAVAGIVTTNEVDSTPVVGAYGMTLACSYTTKPSHKDSRSADAIRTLASVQNFIET